MFSECCFTVGVKALAYHAFDVASCEIVLAVGW